MELARAVGISQGYAARVLGFLRDAGVVVQSLDGYLVSKARDLMEAWATTRRFGKGDVLQTYTILGDPASVERQFVEVARRLNASYALTLMSGAAHRAPFVRGQAVHAYLEGDPSSIVRELQARPVVEGGNLVLAKPYDDGVFYGLQEVNGIRVVSDVQLYVDLVNFGARGREQADFLLEKCLSDLASSDSPEVKARFLEAIKIRDLADQTLRRRHDYAQAASLYENVVGTLALLNTPEVAGELRRAKLLLWISLAHLAEFKQDPVALEKARAILVTDHEVEELRKEVGYNTALTEFALTAYFAALADQSSEVTERRRYHEKAQTHASLARNLATGSDGDLAKETGDILARLQSRKSGP